MKQARNRSTNYNAIPSCACKLSCRLSGSTGLQRQTRTTWTLDSMHACEHTENRCDSYISACKFRRISTHCSIEGVYGVGASSVSYEFAVRNLPAAYTVGAKSGHCERPPPLEELLGLPIFPCCQPSTIDAHTLGKSDFPVCTPNSPSNREACTTTVRLVTVNLRRPPFCMDGV